MANTIQCQRKTYTTETTTVVNSGRSRRQRHAATSHGAATTSENVKPIAGTQIGSVRTVSHANHNAIHANAYAPVNIHSGRE